MRPEHPTRRRAITILAAAAAGAYAGGLARSAADLAWHGMAMGADASILFSGVEQERARAVAPLRSPRSIGWKARSACSAATSEISRLNREERLHSPSGDMRRALELALGSRTRADGLFDPTVQALWEAHVDWFAAAPDGELAARAADRSRARGGRLAPDHAGARHDPARSAASASPSMASARATSPTGSRTCCAHTTCGMSSSISASSARSARARTAHHG